VLNHVSGTCPDAAGCGLTVHSVHDAPEKFYAIAHGTEVLVFML
jgi:hypothetical protein